MFHWHRIDSLHRCEILKDNSQVEVFDAKNDSFKDDGFNLIYIHHKEWEFTYRNQAVFCWSDLHHLFLWATKE
jgi:hypothetical protein